MVELSEDPRRVYLQLNLNPVPASRPRVTRWGTYYSKTYKNWKAEADKAIPRCPGDPFTGLVRVQIVFNVLKPKTSKLPSPRGDIDNYIKAALDAVTGHKSNPKGYWLDDDQVSVVLASKRFVPANPNITITIVEDLP